MGVLVTCAGACSFGELDLGREQAGLHDELCGAIGEIPFVDPLGVESNPPFASVTSFDDTLIVEIQAADVLNNYWLYVGTSLPAEPEVESFPFLGSPQTQAASIHIPFSDLGIPPGTCPELHIALAIEDGSSYSPADDPTLYTPPDLGDGFSRAESWSYDADAAMTRETLGDGTEFVSTFDPTSGRLTQLDVSDGTQVIFSYQSGGQKQLSSVLQTEPGRPDVGLTFGYAGPELRSIAYSEGAATLGTVAYSSATFHTLGEIVETIDGADAVTFAFDNDELLSSVGVLSVTRDPQNGRAIGMAVDGLSATIGYESHGDESNYVVSFNSGEIYRSELFYDRLGRVGQQNVTIGGVLETRDYVYDPNGRLAQVFDGLGALLEDYSYDGRNNRISVLGIDPLTISVDDQDQLLRQGDLLFGYNLRGDLETIDRAGQVTSLVYDATSTLRQVALPNATVIDYHLDPEGDWIGRAVDGVRTDTYIPGPTGRPLVHIDVATGTRTRFVYGGLPTTPSYMERDGVRYAFVNDNRGSVRLVVRLTDGVVVQRLDYDSHGRVLSDTNPGFQPFGFAGGLYDPATSLVRMGARTYFSEVGRFLQRDPAGFPDGPNRYAYVAGDPINFIDLSGLGFQSWSFRFFEDVGNGAAGYMDSFTFGATRSLRQALDADDQVDPCSGWYRAGQAVDEISGYLSGAGAIRNLARKGLKKGLKYAKKRLKKRPCKSSFVAGTPVATPNGSLDIEHVAPGDQVLCRDEQTGVEGVCTVLSTFSRTGVRTLEIVLRDETGQLEHFETTANHPFFTGSFVPAGHVRPGDVVYGLDDQLLIVESVSWGGIETVYNFEVGQAHSYFVGESGAWVHNGGKPRPCDTLRPGANANESVPARGPDRDFTPSERDEVNRIGEQTGCHTCGATSPGTKSGNWVPDHQPPSGISRPDTPQELYPHCISCSRRQGGHVRVEKGRRNAGNQ